MKTQKTIRISLYACGILAAAASVFAAAGEGGQEVKNETPGLKRDAICEYDGTKVNVCKTIQTCAQYFQIDISCTETGAGDCKARSYPEVRHGNCEEIPGRADCKCTVK